MLNSNVIHGINQQDRKMIGSITYTMVLYKDANLEYFWEEIKSQTFENHIIGKEESYIWIKRKSDNVIIATIN